jgi:hypothetical protein
VIPAFKEFDFKAASSIEFNTDTAVTAKIKCELSRSSNLPYVLYLHNKFSDENAK